LRLRQPAPSLHVCACLPRQPIPGETRPHSRSPLHAKQALCVATLGTAADAQRIDGIRSATADSAAGSESDSGSGGGGGGGSGRMSEVETFYLQYFFPPSSVGETGRVGPAGARSGCGVGGAGRRSRAGRATGCGGRSGRAASWGMARDLFWLERQPKPTPPPQPAAPAPCGAAGTRGRHSDRHLGCYSGRRGTPTRRASPLHQDTPFAHGAAGSAPLHHVPPPRPLPRPAARPHRPRARCPGPPPGRRELGHGELAQRALAPIIPSKDDFPYTVRGWGGWPRALEGMPWPPPLSAPGGPARLVWPGAACPSLLHIGLCFRLSTSSTCLPATRHPSRVTRHPLTQPTDPCRVDHHREQWQQQHGLCLRGLPRDARRG
jgi:hypothetical protein